MSFNIGLGSTLGMEPNNLYFYDAFKVLSSMLEYRAKYIESIVKV